MVLIFLGPDVYIPVISGCLIFSCWIFVVPAISVPGEFPELCGAPSAGGGSGEQRLDGHGHHVIYVIHNLSLRLLDTIGMDVAHMFCQHSRMCFLGFCGLRHAPFAGLALDPALVAFRDMPIF